MTMTSQELLTKLRADIKSGVVTKIPSSRHLARSYGLHRNTCLKVLRTLRAEALIDVTVGRTAKKVAPGISPVDTAIDHLLSQGMSLNEAKNFILNKCDERRTITVVGANKDLIEFELSDRDDFTLSDSGLRVSDKVQEGDFLLRLSDMSLFNINTIKTVTAVGIVSKFADFRSHVEGCLTHSRKEILHSSGDRASVKTVLRFSRVILCDLQIEAALKQFAINQRKSSGDLQAKIIPIPYLHETTIRELRKKCWI